MFIHQTVRRNRSEFKIKQAVPGEALIFGNCVPMPIMVKIKEAEPAPNSKNCDIKMEWFNKDKDNTNK